MATSSVNFTIIPAIAFPTRTPIASALPPVSSTGWINFLNQLKTALIGFKIGSIAVPICLNKGIKGFKPSTKPCHNPLKNPAIGFQYL